MATVRSLTPRLCKKWRYGSISLEKSPWNQLIKLLRGLRRLRGLSGVNGANIVIIVNVVIVFKLVKLHEFN